MAEPDAPHGVDPQDALPENTWGWRRLFIYGATIVGLILLAVIVHKVSEGEYLAGIAYGLIGLIAWLATLYLIAPSGEHIARILSLSAILKAARPDREGADYSYGYDDDLPPWERRR